MDEKLSLKLTGVQGISTRCAVTFTSVVEELVDTITATQAFDDVHPDVIEALILMGMERAVSQIKESLKNYILESREFQKALSKESFE